MSVLVESLRRLYRDGKVAKSKLLEMVSDGKITYEEYEYIIERNREGSLWQ